MNFVKTALASTVFALSLAGPSISIAQATGKPSSTASAPLTDAQLNSVIDQLVKSGKFDTAVRAGIERYIADQRAKAMKEEESRQAQMADLANLARKVNPSRDHIFGNPRAEWSIIVYSDLECAFCKMHGGIPEGAAQKVGLDKVNVVFRHFPLPSHGEAARKEAVASECVAKQAGNDGFFKFINTVLQKTRLNGNGLPGGDNELMSIAKDSGAKDEKQFEQCIQDPKSSELVKADYEDGMQAGVTGTPGNIIRNNKTGKSTPAHGADREISGMEAKLKAAMSGQPMVRPGMPQR